jgi:hypothetical protein
MLATTTATTTGRTSAKACTVWRSAMNARYEPLAGNEQQGERDRQRGAQHETALQRTFDGRSVPGANGLRDQWVECHQRAVADRDDAVEVDVPECHGGETCCRIPPDDGGIHDAHQHQPDLHDNDRRGEPRHIPHFVTRRYPERLSHVG